MIQGNVVVSNLDTFTRSTVGHYNIDYTTIAEAAINTPRFETDGLLVEEGKINYMEYSQQLEQWSQSDGAVTTTDVTVAPDGTTTADLCDVSAQSTSRILRAYTGAAADYYTLSIYLKSSTVDGTYAIRLRNSTQNDNYDTLVPIYADRWVRYVDTRLFTSGDTIVAYAGQAQVVGATLDKAYVWGTQLERGSYPSSYIENVGLANNARGDDVLDYSIGSTITQGQGSLYCEFNCLGRDGVDNSRIIEISDGSNTNRMLVYIDTDNPRTRLLVQRAGVSQVLFSDSQDFEFNVVNKLMITYENNNTALYLNGRQAGIDTACTIPTVFTTLHIGNNTAGEAQLNGSIKNVRYYDTALTQAQGERLTR